MQLTKEEVLADIEADKREVRFNALLTIITFAGLLSGVACQLSGAPGFYVILSFVAAYLAGGIPATIEAAKTLWQRKLDINLLMILAALAAAGVGEVRDGAILLFLFSLAGTLEAYAMGNTKRAVASLMEMRPEEANVLNDNGQTSKTAVSSVKIGARIMIRPGERIPLDGVIETGVGAIDQSPVTGESIPVDKKPGDAVFAGTVNRNSVLMVRVTELAGRSTIARMIELVTEAQEKRSPSERFGDWFGERYTVAVLAGSILGLGIFILAGLPLDEAMYKAATLLVVASPCAIVISVPAAVLSALAAAAKAGVLFKGGAALEEFGSVSAIAFDKTGTLTKGLMAVNEVLAFSDNSETDVISLGAGLESHSEHPLAHSVREYAEQKGIRPLSLTGAAAVPGKGIIADFNGTGCFAGNRSLLADQNIIIPDHIEESLAALEAEGRSTIIVGQGTRIMGVIGISDQLRDTAKPALAALQKRGVSKLVILTGDAKTVAASIGGQLGMAQSDVYGSLLPEGKVQVVEKLRQDHKVAFVGDGVNDAAALATAHVGIAMGAAGSDVALEAADVALLSDDLDKLAGAHDLSKKANRIIRQNLIFAVGIMIVMVTITIFGHLPLPLGVIGHEGGTLLVVANGLRLLFAFK